MRFPPPFGARYDFTVGRWVPTLGCMYEIGVDVAEGPYYPCGYNEGLLRELGESARPRLRRKQEILG